MKQLKILAISGSLRKDSYNRKTLQIAKKIALEAGESVEEADLRDINLPIYDGDIEEKGLPESARRIKEKAEAADILFIASPEYNYSVSGALKNVID